MPTPPPASAGAGDETGPPAPPETASSASVHLILDLEGADAEPVARALEIGLYEAQQKVRLGGYQLLRTLEPPAADDLMRRFVEHGLRVVAVPEARAKTAAQPHPVRGGRLEDRALVLRGRAAERRVEAADVLLVVQGPIARERATPRPQVRWGLFQMGGNFGLPGIEVGTATLEPGYRFHLHLTQEAAPLEIDPASFSFTSADVGSGSTRRVQEWLALVVSPPTIDDTFRRLPPVLAPAPPEDDRLTAALGRRPPKGAGDEAATVLDNLRQFRFYSGWRAAVERTRAARGGEPSR